MTGLCRYSRTRVLICTRALKDRGPKPDDANNENAENQDDNPIEGKEDKTRDCNKNNY